MIERIWYGSEAEGSRRDSTVFIEAETLDRTDIDLIKSAAKKANSRRLYFGAGEITPLEIERSVLEALRDFECFVEVDAEDPMLVDAYLENVPDWVTIIPRLYVSNVERFSVVKLRDYDKVRVFEKYADNTTKDLEDGLYKNDTLFYENSSSCND